MFEELNNQAAAAPVDQPTDSPAVTPVSASAPENAVQDIFANVESPAPSLPTNSQPFGQPSMPAGLPTNSQPVSQAIPKSGGKAKLILISLAVLILAAGGALAYLQYFKKTPPEVITPEAIVSDGNSLVIPTEVTPAEVTTSESAVVTTTDLTGTGTLDSGVIEPATSSETGLSVLVEQPTPEVANNLDSDQDGLTDAEELNIYQTNPLQADTDGDGYIDGDEVKTGHNPLGEGLLAQ